jgi:hypothetical protein
MMKLALCLVLAAACGKSEPAEPAHHEDRADPAVASPALGLEIRVDGAVAAKLDQALFDRVAHFQRANNSGEARDTWSLRELVEAGVGPSARVTAVIGESKKAITAAEWNDASHTPIVHRTRRGTLKFRWADKDGKWGESDVKDVTALEVTR